MKDVKLDVNGYDDALAIEMTRPTSGEVLVAVLGFDLVALGALQCTSEDKSTILNALACHRHPKMQVIESLNVLTFNHDGMPRCSQGKSSTKIIMNQSISVRDRTCHREQKI